MKKFLCQETMIQILKKSMQDQKLSSITFANGKANEDNFFSK